MCYNQQLLQGKAGGRVGLYSLNLHDITLEKDTFAWFLLKKQGGLYTVANFPKHHMEELE